MSITTADCDLDRDFALRARLEALFADYAHAIDDDRLEDWPGFFTERGVYRVTTRENHDAGLPLSLIYCDGAGMMADRVSALRQANIYEPHVYCHMTSGLRVVEATSDGWRVRSNFTVLRTMSEGDTMVFACGRAFDRVTEQDGRLRFAERLVVLDSRRVDTLLVLPI